MTRGRYRKANRSPNLLPGDVWNVHPVADAGGATLRLWSLTFDVCLMRFSRFAMCNVVELVFPMSVQLRNALVAF